MGGLWKFNPCETCCTDCDCDDSTPTQYQVVLAGFLDRTGFGCDCTGINGTYVLDRISDGVSAFGGNVVCRWRYIFDPVLCDLNYLEIHVSKGDPTGLMFSHLYESANPSAHNYRGTYAAFNKTRELTNALSTYTTFNPTIWCAAPGDPRPTATVTAL